MRVLVVFDLDVLFDTEIGLQVGRAEGFCKGCATRGYLVISLIGFHEAYIKSGSTSFYTGYFYD